MIDLLLKLRTLVLSKTAKDTSVIFTGNAVSSVLGIVFTILAARFLGPENWGIVAAVASLITIFVAIGDLGLGASVFRFLSKKWSQGEGAQSQRIYRAIFSFRMAAAFLLALLVIIFSSYVSRFFLGSEDSTLALFVALGLFAVLMLEFQIVSMQAKRNWKVAAVFLSSSNFVRVLLLLFLLYAGLFNLRSVLFVFSGSVLFVCLISLFWQASLPSFAGWQAVLRKIAPFSGWMAGNKIVSSVNSRVDVLLLISIAGAYDAGIYAAANRLAIGVPLLVGSFATVLAPRFASLEDKNALFGFFKKSIGLSSLIAVVLVLGVFLAPFIILLFGPEYVGSGAVLQWLLIAFIPFVLATPAVNILIYHFEKPRIITLLSAFQLPFIFLLNFLLIPKIGVFAPVIVLGLVNFSTMLVAYFFAWRYLRA